jgi:hypothetical protein
MPRSQGRIIVSPTAPLDILQAIQPLGGGGGGCSQALSRKLATPRGEEEPPRSASPTASPRQRPRRLPGGIVLPESPPGGPREAWGLEGDSPRQGGSASRGCTFGKGKRGGIPQAPQLSVEFQNTSLFGGERNTNHKCKRGFATTFRRPTSCKQPPHQRPIFVVGPDAQDPKICVDNNAPGRFSSFERTRYELSWRQAEVSRGEGSRPLPEASIRNIGGSASMGSGRGAMGTFEGRSATPIRPQSVGSVGYHRGSSGPSPLPGQRALPLSRPTSQQQPSRPPPGPACWSGA